MPCTYQHHENIAAIALDMGAHKLYHQVYKTAAEGHGFPIFFQVAIEAAGALERVEKKLKIKWGENADWILTVEAFVTAIFEKAIDLGYFPQGGSLDKLA
jgi:hypothetical protein